MQRVRRVGDRVSMKRNGELGTVRECRRLQITGAVVYRVLLDAGIETVLHAREIKNA